MCHLLLEHIDFVVDSSLTMRDYRRAVESYAAAVSAFLAMDRVVPASFAVGLPLVTRVN